MVDTALRTVHNVDMTTEQFFNNLAIRDVALDAIAATVQRPDLSAYEVTIPGSVGRYAVYASHTHGNWQIGHSPAGNAIWHCGGCWFNPQVIVPLPDPAKRIMAEWWDGYRVDTAATHA